MFILKSVFGMMGPFYYVIPIIIYVIFKINNKKKNDQLPEGYASFEIRLCAFIIDYALIILLDYFTESFLYAFIFAVIDLIILPSRTGWSVGKRILKIKIIKSNGKKADGFDLFTRELIKNMLSISILCLGCLWMMISKNKLTWHDSGAATRVVSISHDTNES